MDIIASQGHRSTGTIENGSARAMRWSCDAAQRSRIAVAFNKAPLATDYSVLRHAYACRKHYRRMQASFRQSVSPAQRIDFQDESN
jgi:hypothetical protein